MILDFFASFPRRNKSADPRPSAAVGIVCLRRVAFVEVVLKGSQEEATHVESTPILAHSQWKGSRADSIGARTYSFRPGPK